MIRQGGDRSVDLAAVARDDLLLDVIGGRLAPVDPGDHTARLLQALATEVDAGLPELIAATPLTDETPLGAVRRRRVARGTVVALVLGATLSVGGVSAAVTGDPLAAYHSVAKVFTPHDDLPPHAAEIAHLNRMVTNARGLARTDDPGAAAALDALRAAVAAATDLPAGRRAALERKIAAVQAILDAPDSGAPGAPGAKPAAGRSADAPGHASTAPGSSASKRGEPGAATAPRQDRATEPSTSPAPGPGPSAGSADTARATGEAASRR